MDMLNIESEEILKSAYEGWIKEALNVKMAGRDSKGTETAAVGG